MSAFHVQHTDTLLHQSMSHTFNPRGCSQRFLFLFSANNSNHFDNEISAGYSEDSDYTSDLNYPVGQHPNSSASQFRSAVITRSPETSRENSYERDDSMGHHHQYQLSQPQSTNQHHLSPGTYRRHQPVRIVCLLVIHKKSLCLFITNTCLLLSSRGIHQMQKI